MMTGVILMDTKKALQPTNIMQSLQQQFVKTVVINDYHIIIFKTKL